MTVKFLFILLFVMTACKASESNPNKEDEVTQEQKTIVTQLDYSLAPEECHVLINVFATPEIETINCSVVKMIKRGMGFNSYLNAGDTILLLSKKPISIDSTYQVILEAVRRPGINNTFKINKIID